MIEGLTVFPDGDMEVNLGIYVIGYDERKKGPNWEKEKGANEGRWYPPEPRTEVEPVKIVTPPRHLIFRAGKLSDVLYVPPWRWILYVGIELNEVIEAYVLI